MIYKFHCPHCDQRFSAEPHEAGLKTECVVCQNQIVIPEQEPTVKVQTTSALVLSSSSVESAEANLNLLADLDLEV